MPLEYRVTFDPDPPYGTFVVRFWDPATLRKGAARGSRVDTRRVVPELYWRELGHETPRAYVAGEKKSEKLRDLAIAWATQECARIEARVRIRRGEALERGRELGLEAALDWYIAKNPNDGTAATIYKYKQMKARLVGHFGATRLPSTIGADAVIEYRNAMQKLKAPLRNRTIKNDAVFLKQALTYMYEQRDSHDNPCNVRELRLLKFPRRWITKQKSRRRALSEEDLASIIRVRLPRDKDRIIRILIYAFTAGLRRWPLLHLERTWIDATKGTQRIPGWAMKGGENRWGDEDFEVPICRWAIEAATPSSRHAKWTWPNPITGKPNTQIDRSIRTVARLAKVDVFSLQDLRKTFASILSNAGVHELEIAILQGHASSSVTREYITKHPDALRKAVAHMDALRTRLEKTPENVVRISRG